MRTTSKVVLVIIIITLVYSIVKLINASTPKGETIATITFPIGQSGKQNAQSMKNDSENNMTTATPQSTAKSTQTLYHADEILIDGQGQAGQNYIDITSTTPITPQTEQTPQAGNTQNNSGNAYAQASVTIDNSNTSAQTYAPGVPAFEVLDGN